MGPSMANVAHPAGPCTPSKPFFFQPLVPRLSSTAHSLHPLSFMTLDYAHPLHILLYVRLSSMDPPGTPLVQAGKTYLIWISTFTPSPARKQRPRQPLCLPIKHGPFRLCAQLVCWYCPILWWQPLHRKEIMNISRGGPPGPP